MILIIQTFYFTFSFRVSNFISIYYLDLVTGWGIFITLYFPEFLTRKF